MTQFYKLAIGSALAAVLLSQPAIAQQRRAAAAPAPVATTAANAVKGIAILNLEATIVNSDAYRYAMQQQQVTYKAQIDAAKQRQANFEAQAKPLVDKLNADIAAKRPDAELQVQANTIRNLKNQADGELEQIIAPVALSDSYVKEQIAGQLDRAVQNAMTKRGVSLVLSPDAVIARSNSYDLTRDVIAELNILLPAARIQVIPPAGWVPANQRQQQQAAQPRPAATVPAATAPQPKPAGPQPVGR